MEPAIIWPDRSLSSQYPWKLLPWKSSVSMTSIQLGITISMDAATTEAFSIHDQYPAGITISRCSYNGSIQYPWPVSSSASQYPNVATTEVFSIHDQYPAQHHNIQMLLPRKYPVSMTSIQLSITISKCCYHGSIQYPWPVSSSASQYPNAATSEVFSIQHPGPVSAAVQ